MILFIKIVLYFFAGIVILFGFGAVICSGGVRAGTPMPNHLKGIRYTIPSYPPRKQ